jgi:hypothetical protein
VHRILGLLLADFIGGPLSAVGDAFDTSSNVDYGSVSTTMNSAYQATPYQASMFNGQLVFNLPASIIGHQLRITVSVYEPQYGYASSYANGYGPLVATAGQMVQVNLAYGNGYPYGNGNGYCYGSYNNCYPTYTNYCNGYYQASYCNQPSYNQCYYYRTYYYYRGTYRYYYYYQPNCDYHVSKP